MPRFVALLGKRVNVLYRAGEIYLPATGVLVADSGKSIFLEERIRHRERDRTFRWEIPYHHVVRLREVLADAAPASTPGASATSSAGTGSEILPLHPLPEKAGV